MRDCLPRGTRHGDRYFSRRGGPKPAATFAVRTGQRPMNGARGGGEPGRRGDVENGSWRPAYGGAPVFRRPGRRFRLSQDEFSDRPLPWRGFGLPRPAVQVGLVAAKRAHDTADGFRGGAYFAKTSGAPLFRDPLERCRNLDRALGDQHSFPGRPGQFSAAPSSKTRVRSAFEFLRR